MLMFCLFVIGWAFMVLAWVDSKRKQNPLKIAVECFSAAVFFGLIAGLQFYQKESVLALINCFTAACLILSGRNFYSIHKLEKAYPLRNRVKP